MRCDHEPDTGTRPGSGPVVEPALSAIGSDDHQQRETVQDAVSPSSKP